MTSKHDFLNRHFPIKVLEIKSKLPNLTSNFQTQKKKLVTIFFLEFSVLWGLSVNIYKNKKIEGPF